MHLTVISSLDALCRQQACEAMAAANAQAVLVLHDLLENGLVIRRIFTNGALVERTETQLEHGCLSCTIRLDVVPTVERLLERGEEMVIIGLPPGVSSESAIGALRRGLPHSVTVDSAVLACAPDTLEDHLWDKHTLFESGFTPVPEDHRTPGEFLIGELCFNDTALLAEPALVPVDAALRRRGIQLVRELAPHADVVVDPAEIRTGRHDYQEARCRTVPGSVRIPAAVSASPFTTVTHRAGRPLHPERFRDALASLAEGCCWLRGRLWIAAAPRCRIAIQGIGPLVWLENTGPWLADREASAAPDHLDNVDARLDWHPEHGDRCTVIAATGEGLDPAEIAGLLAGCELTDAEMDAGFAALADPFQLDPAPHFAPHSN
ncbi:GTP-binding protein [Arthrobacter sp. S39]|uniref:GTP-binding protein n=1 Tax=Arthrobacter sp. S39 TaxID=2509720 RepID=UPI001037A784|nr:GTP-binding protein [Arthrobacter sp. S39]TAP39977.1 GTP-binding protein [Arthrobacter sp. S39]